MVALPLEVVYAVMMKMFPTWLQWKKLTKHNWDLAE